MRASYRLLVALAALALALAACGGGNEISEVTCGELGIGGPDSELEQNDERFDEIVSQIVDEVDGDVEAEIVAGSALSAACVREDDPSYKPGDEALEYVRENP